MKYQHTRKRKHTTTKRVDNSKRSALIHTYVQRQLRSSRAMLSARSDCCDRLHHDKTASKSRGDRPWRGRLTCPTVDRCVSISDKVNLRPRTHGPLAMCAYLCKVFGRLRLLHAAFASQMTDDARPLDKATRDITKYCLRSR